MDAEKGRKPGALPGRILRLRWVLPSLIAGLFVALSTVDANREFGIGYRPGFQSSGWGRYSFREYALIIQPGGLSLKWSEKSPVIPVSIFASGPIWCANYHGGFFGNALSNEMIDEMIRGAPPRVRWSVEPLCVLPQVDCSPKAPQNWIFCPYWLIGLALGGLIFVVDTRHRPISDGRFV